ncbi:PEP-CTERM sorting domain-containing protein [Motiliproteus sp. MSK22-1]|uniref:PEP-CTERM sorting domain-containing protein n=1 Tax=Motiliproteus sp. MSK22-1 TaxID=1897630 RepID=UPI000975CBA0|nr:PEP-CTERM sorting domain-containing protein [Motiliproteus sp. MSK22-1]OMH38829.1 hypothetical protein BGP75_00165 [Motiliproteus sp. MSK22-1]
MKKLAFLCALFLSGLSNAGTIYLDMDTNPTGQNLGNAPLITSEGTITFLGAVSRSTDVDFEALGATGNNLDIASFGSGASLRFNFDVTSFEFIFGGNSGQFDMVAKNIFNNTVDSFFQASTGSGEFAGPVTLSGVGIRSISWNDPAGGFAAIDNVTITAAQVSESTSIALLGLGLIGLYFGRRKDFT